MIFIGVRRGAVKTLVIFAGSVAAYIISSWLGKLMASGIYNTFFKERIIENVSDTVSNTAAQSVNEINNSSAPLPDFIARIFENFGITSDYIGSGMETAVDNASGSVASSVESAVEPLLTAFIAMLVTLIMFILLLFLVKILAKVIDKAFHVPVLNQLNRIGGGITGFAQGIFVAFMVCFVLALVLPFAMDNYIDFYKNTIDQTYIFKHIFNISTLK